MRWWASRSFGRPVASIPAAAATLAYVSEVQVIRRCRAQNIGIAGIRPAGELTGLQAGLSRRCLQQHWPFHSCSTLIVCLVCSDG